MKPSHNQILIGIALLALATAFAAGRYSVPVSKVVEKQKTVVEKLATDTKESEKTDKDKDRHTTTTKKELKRKDGTTLTETTTIEDVIEKSMTEKNTDKKTESEKTVLTKETTETVRARGHLNVNVLVGQNFNDLSKGLIFGVGVSKNVVGPVTFGLWGLQNKTGGFSLGLEF